jgi:hypothetical protein
MQFFRVKANAASHFSESCVKNECYLWKIICFYVSINTQEKTLFCNIEKCTLQFSNSKSHYITKNNVWMGDFAIHGS